MKVSKPQNMTPNATASMAAVIRSTPRQRIRGRVARMAPGSLSAAGAGTAVEWCAFMALCLFPWNPCGWMPRGGEHPSYRPAGAGAQQEYGERAPEILNFLRRCEPEQVRGSAANRTLSAVGRSPVVTRMTIHRLAWQALDRRAEWDAGRIRAGGHRGRVGLEGPRDGCRDRRGGRGQAARHQ